MTLEQSAVDPTVALLQLDYVIGESLGRNCEEAWLALQRAHLWALALGAAGLFALAEESLLLLFMLFLSALLSLWACSREVGAFRRARRGIRFERAQRENLALVILDQADPVAQIFADRMLGYLSASEERNASA